MNRGFDVYKALESGCRTEYEIADLLGCSVVASRHALRRLCASGKVRRVPAQYSIILRVRNIEDGRGKSPASRANLLLSDPRKAALIKHGRAGTLRKREPVIELEKCWPMP